MFKKSAFILCGFLLLVFSVAAFAALSKSSGLYVEGNVGIATDTDWAGIVNAGYKFDGHLALEGGVAFLDSNYLDMVVKGIIPFDNGFEVFVKLGPAIKHFKMSKLEIYGGAGAGYAFTPNLSASIQGLWISDNSYAGTVGLTYIF